jgi:XTP/dITP diphosphohydrolase
MSQSDEPIVLATSNVHKYQEISEILSECDITIQQRDIKPLEIQSDSLEEIVTASINQVACPQYGAVLVEDSGLFIDSLGGFPGPYSSYAHRTLGNVGILRLMSGIESRRACFKSVLAFLRTVDMPVLFQGTAVGRISEAMIGSEGFGFDPIFIPDEGDGRTFGQMRTNEKNELSHRAKAARKFAAWYTSMR